MNNYLVHSVQLQTKSSDNSFGEGVFSAGVNYNAFIRFKTKMITDSFGNQVLANCSVKFPAGVSISEGDRIIYNNRTMTVVGFDMQSNLGNEIYFKKVYCV